VVTNSKIDLAFVSPKSARAVSFNVGKNYANKLLKLPQFLISEHIEPDYLSLLAGLKLTEFFIEKFLISEKNFYNSKQYLFYRNNIRDKITVSPISNQLEID
jgi:DNA repair protein RecO (recombination protein O)